MTAAHTTVPVMRPSPPLISPKGSRLDRRSVRTSPSGSAFRSSTRTTPPRRYASRRQVEDGSRSRPRSQRHPSGMPKGPRPHEPGPFASRPEDLRLLRRELLLGEDALLLQLGQALELRDDVDARG